MTYDFTSTPRREGTHALKWDNVAPGTRTPVPLWVADMDFSVAPAIKKALETRVHHGIFGYTNLPHEYWLDVCRWYQTRYDRSWTPNQLLACPSVLQGLAMAVRALTEPGDRILNFPPVYYPFWKVIQLNGRTVVDVPMIRQPHWRMDWVGVENALVAAQREGKPVKAVLLSAPQNPTGRAWTVSELEQLETLAERFNLLVFSDEIHADLVQPGQRHWGPSDLPRLQNRTLVFAGPNKTFNLAGLPMSHVFSTNEDLRQAMKMAIAADFFDQPNVLSLTAAWAAYREGGAWVDQLLQVIQQNKVLLDKTLQQWNRDWDLEVALTSAPLEATYLAWVDATGLIRAANFPDDQTLAGFLEKTYQVKVTPGSTFRNGGENHLRINLATPRSLLKEGLDRMAEGFSLKIREARN